MIRIFIFVFIFIHLNAYSCVLKKDFKYISLSSPVTYLLNHLDLISDVNLKGVSEYHFFEKKKFKGKVYSGGIFLSTKELMSLKEPMVIFFDESVDLKNNLNQLKSINSSIKELVEIKTKQLDPFEQWRNTNVALSKYLDSCQSVLGKVEQEVQEINLKQRSEKIPFLKVVFFLGLIEKEKQWPRYVIGNDLFNKFWLKYNLIAGYPSSLNYIEWSTLYVEKLKKEGYYFVGLGEGEKDIKMLSSNVYNINYPQLFIPGLSQIYFMRDYQKEFVSRMVKN